MTRRRRYLIVLAGAAGALAMAAAVLGGAAVTGQAATVQTVVATNVCQPGPSAKPGTTIGCVLTVTNNGVNSANSVIVTDVVSGGGTLLSTSDSSKCTISNAQLTLTCTIGKVAGGASFAETHMVQLPNTGTVLQTVDGRYSPNPNNRTSDTIATVATTTTLDNDDDFDAKLAGDGGFVQTGQSLSGSNPYATGAKVVGTSAVAAGLSVRDDGLVNSALCPTGCYGSQTIQFNINPLTGTPYPASFTLTIVIAGAAVGNGTKTGDLNVRHTTGSGTELVPTCTTPPAAPAVDSVGDCVVSKSIDPSTKIATIVITGPGTGNGGWGVGKPG